MIFIENQVSLVINKTVMGKSHLEQWLWKKSATEVSNYHDEYSKYCDDKGQNKSFSGVGSQHKNTQSECEIQTIIYMARAFMVHN